MDIPKLKAVESAFFNHYPKGFDEPEIQKIVKKHNTAKRSEQVQERFAPDLFARPEIIVENFVKTINQSSLISLFEKPKLRDAVAMWGMERKNLFSEMLYELLHDEKSTGFEGMVGILAQDKLAKWPIMTLIPYYYARDLEIFVKPTTTKNIIGFFGIKDLLYKPKPTYDFYLRYHEIIREMKTHVDPALGRDNAGFTGFLMMGMKMVDAG